MKPTDDPIHRVVAEWLRKANDDLNLADYLLTTGTAFPNAITFHAQQAAEKYLKALLTRHQVLFPKTHDLAQLLELSESIDADLAVILQDIIMLTPYGVELRYPGDRPDATADEAREAVLLARKVHTAVIALLGSANFDIPPA